MRDDGQTCDRGCLRGRPKCEHCIRDVASNRTDDDIQSVVDAVSGATWNTRNQIMEGLFFEDLETDPSSVPSCRPPGCA